LAKGRGETNGMELTIGEHYQLPEKLLEKVLPLLGAPG
jgi:hypothetical protein